MVHRGYWALVAVDMAVILLVVEFVRQARVSAAMIVVLLAVNAVVMRRVFRPKEGADISGPWKGSAKIRFWGYAFVGSGAIGVFLLIRVGLDLPYLIGTISSFVIGVGALTLASKMKT